MAPGVEVVELIGVETQGAVGGEMEGDDACRCGPKKNGRCDAGGLVAGQDDRSTLATSQGPVLRGVVEELDRLDPSVTHLKELGKSHGSLGELRVVEHGSFIT